MRKLKLAFTLTLLALAVGCTNPESMEDMQPSEVVIENPQSPSEIDEIPVTLSTMFITVEYSRGFDRQAFRDKYGPQMGMTLVGNCESAPEKEVWMVNYLTEEDFATLLEELFPFVSPPGTNSNGGGADEGYVTYDPDDSSETDRIDHYSSPVIFYYNGSCN